MKLLKGLCIIALMIAFAIPAYAETQSIKLSGDLAIRYIGRDNYDFNSFDPDHADTDGSYFMHNAEVQLDADLTDNVSVTIRLVNQTDWDVSDIYLYEGEYYDYDWHHLTGNSPDGVQDHYGEFDVLVDLAYITLKEFFFTPLTVRIGKQDLWFGKGFIVGANYDDPNGQIEADEFTSFTSFKAIRATWDFEPWTLDAVFAMIEENEVQADDDVQLYGVNLGCVLDYYNAETELYYWLKRDDEIPRAGHPHTGAAREGFREEDRIHTIGLRGSFDPHEDITLWGEGAIQRGIYIADMNQQLPRDRSAWAVDLGGEARLWEDQYAWKPVVGIEYIFYSGQNAMKDHVGSDYHGWDRMYRGKVDSAIHEWYNVFYTTGMSTTAAEDRGDTNLHQLILMGTVQPMDNLTVDARLINFRLHENADRGGNLGMWSDEKGIGTELDLELTYEYTEDVTFGLLNAWFWAGDYYSTPEQGGGNGAANNAKAKDVASELVATCKVAF